MKKYVLLTFIISIMILSTLFVNSQNNWWSDSPDIPIIKELVYGNNRFIGINKERVYISADGDNWDMETVKGFDGSRIYYDGLQYFVLDKDKIWNSRNTHSWKYQKVTGEMNDIVYGRYQYVAVGKDGYINTSNDSWNWSSKRYGKVTLNSVVWTGKKFVAVGESGIIITSEDGKSWKTINTGISQNLKSVCWNDSKLIAVGDNNSIISSDENAEIWTKQTYYDSAVNNFVRVNWGYDKFYVISSNKIVSSKDGTSWRLNAGSLGGYLSAFATNGKKYLAIDYKQAGFFESSDGLSWKDKAGGKKPVITSTNNLPTIKNLVNRSLAEPSGFTEIIAKEMENIQILTEKFRNNSMEKTLIISEFEKKSINY